MQMSGLVVLLVTMVASRIISERGYRTLDSDTKLRLMDGFSKTRSYSMIPFVILIGTFCYLMTQTSMNKQMLNIAYFGLLIVYVLFQSILNQMKLTQLAMPTDYRQMFTIAQVVSLIGIAWFFFATFSDIGMLPKT